MPNQKLASTALLHCLDLALYGQAFSYPNPNVGALICFQNLIIANGSHLKAGSEHAEIQAIKQLKRNLAAPENFTLINNIPSVFSTINEQNLVLSNLDSLSLERSIELARFHFNNLSLSQPEEDENLQNYIKVLEKQIAQNYREPSRDNLRYVTKSEFENICERFENINDIYPCLDFYVSLEPCTHKGKTPACAPVIDKLKFYSLTYATRDPNPLVKAYRYKNVKHITALSEQFSDLQYVINYRFLEKFRQLNSEKVSADNQTNSDMNSKSIINYDQSNKSNLPGNITARASQSNTSNLKNEQPDSKSNITTVSLIDQNEQQQVVEAEDAEQKSACASNYQLSEKQISIKIACKSDGSTISTERWITNTRSRLQVQRERACSDLIISGLKSVILDNSRLNVRKSANELFLAENKTAPVHILYTNDLNNEKQLKNLEVFKLNQTNLVQINKNISIGDQVKQNKSIKINDSVIKILQFRDLKSYFNSLKDFNSIYIESGKALSNNLLKAGYANKITHYEVLDEEVSEPSFKSYLFKALEDTLENRYLSEQIVNNFIFKASTLKNLSKYYKTELSLEELRQITLAKILKIIDRYNNEQLIATDYKLLDFDYYYADEQLDIKLELTI
jgi:pyrimidine deaminase RibD-like protein/riboflavin biosynthesis pyrimidine reductase